MNKTRYLTRDALDDESIHAPLMCDFKLGRQISRYLVGTSDYRLDVLKVDTDTIMRFEDYTDADWVSDSADRQ
jgi:hypothetical protein